MTAIRFKVPCPCGNSEACDARLAGFSSTSVQVTACRQCVARSIVGYEVRTSWAYANAVPTATTVAHRDGLVSFA